MGLLDRLQHAWNAFFRKGPPYDTDDLMTPYIPRYQDLGIMSTYRPDRVYFSKGQEKNLISTIFNRIAVDACSMDIRHVKLDDNDRFLEMMDSSLNKCLWLSANKDQTGRAFVQDAVMSMLDEGCIAIVPIDTTSNPEKGTYDILSMRVCKITAWYPDNIQVEAYNDVTGQKQTITIPKTMAAIVENPFYAIMNEPNSALQRLVKKLNLLDVIDSESGSSKLNLIVQLPYIIKTELRKQQAEKRRQDIEEQLSHSKYGIAYTDGTEKVTQLNRPAENSIMESVKYYTSMLYSQLGITQEVLDGTADEKTMLNYLQRCVVPIVTALCEEMTRKFLTKTAITQHQRIKFFNDPFRFVTMMNMAEVSDKMTRNEIMSSNEVRQIIGLKPSNDPDADELRNKNLNKPVEEQPNPQKQANNPDNSQESLDEAAAREYQELMKRGG